MMTLCFSIILATDGGDLNVNTPMKNTSAADRLSGYWPAANRLARLAKAGPKQCIQVGKLGDTCTGGIHYDLGGVRSKNIRLVDYFSNSLSSL